MSIVAELKRRNVFKVAAAYLVAGWLLIEASSVMLEAFDAPVWLPKVVAALLAAGFPLAIFFAWAFEVTPEGIKRESEVDRSTSITHVTSQRLNIVTAVLLVLAIGLFVTEDLWRSPESAVAAAAVTATGDSGLVSIAVMPFANMSADSANEYFADGIAEEVLNLLAGVKTLSVASRTSAFAYKGSDASITDIASSLGVRYVLEGSVRKAGDRVRITAQLIDAGNDRHLWSETFDRALDDIFAIQDEIAGAIGKALRVELLGEGGRVVNAESIDPEAYTKFLEARHLLRRRNPDDVAAATVSLIEVLQVERQFARAHALVAEAYVLRGVIGLAGSDTSAARSGRGIALAAAKYHALVAQQINPVLGGVYLVLGQAKELENDRLGVLRDYQRAIELEPNEARPYQWRSLVYGEAGYQDRAKADTATALRLDPGNANLYSQAGYTAFLDGDLAEARRQFGRISEMGNVLGSEVSLYVLALASGAFDEAESHLDRVTAMLGEDEVTLPRLALAAARDPAQRAAFVSASESAYTRDASFVFQLMQALKLDEALLRLYDRDDLPEIIDGPGRLVWRADHAGVRADPRFVNFMDRLGFVALWREIGPPPDCRADGDSFRCGYGVE